MRKAETGGRTRKSAQPVWACYLHHSNAGAKHPHQLKTPRQRPLPLPRLCELFQHCSSASGTTWSGNYKQDEKWTWSGNSFLIVRRCGHVIHHRPLEREMLERACCDFAPATGRHYINQATPFSPGFENFRCHPRTLERGKKEARVDNMHSTTIFSLMAVAWARIFRWKALGWIILCRAF